MRKVKELKENGLYAIQISASANSALVEKVYQAKKLIQLVNKRLVGFAEVYDFLITEDCIFLVLRIERQQSVLDHYQELRAGSKKADRGLDHEVIWRIISEQFRHLISIYVKWFNRDMGRAGSMVARNYERFVFENIEEADAYMTNMKNELLRKSQKLRKYRTDKRVRGLSRRMKKGMIYLCSLHKGHTEFREFLDGGSLVFMDVLPNVLRKLVYSTFSLHFHQLSTNIIKKPPNF